ncbi:hypothetical protein [Rhabdobacter roseus]|nr:hypothetical protein [Rhabdobacter roseus]
MTLSGLRSVLLPFLLILLFLPFPSQAQDCSGRVSTFRFQDFTISESRSEGGILFSTLILPTGDTVFSITVTFKAWMSIHSFDDIWLFPGEDTWRPIKVGITNIRHGKSEGRYIYTASALLTAAEASLLAHHKIGYAQMDLFIELVPDALQTELKRAACCTFLAQAAE